MRRQQDANDEMQRGWAQQLQRRLQWLQQQQHHHDGGAGYYVVDDDGRDGIEAHNIGSGTHHDCVYYPFSYVMVGDGGQEQEQHRHYVYPQTMTNRPPPPATPAPPSSLPPLLPVSSPPLPPQSYFKRHPSAQMTQQPQQLAPPPTTTLSTSPLPPTMISTSCNTIQQHQPQCTNNSYDYNNEGNNGAVTVKMVANDSSSCFCRLQLKERIFGSGMTSTVVVNNNNNPSQRQRSSVDDETVTETISPATSKQKCEVKNRTETIVNDDKVVSVCKRTITATIQKILIDDYGSALCKLRKTIRILDILMFTEGSSGIGSAKVETVRPWLDTLKDMEQQLSSKQNSHQYNNDNHHGHESRVTTRLKHDYLQQVRKRKHYNSGSGSSGNISIRCNRSYSNSSNRDGSGSTRRNCWRSNTRRYRTTGKLIMGQPRHDINNGHRCKRNDLHSNLDNSSCDDNMNHNNV